MSLYASVNTQYSIQYNMKSLVYAQWVGKYMQKQRDENDTLAYLHDHGPNYIFLLLRKNKSFHFMLIFEAKAIIILHWKRQTELLARGNRTSFRTLQREVDSHINISKVSDIFKIGAICHFYKVMH